MAAFGVKSLFSFNGSYEERVVLYVALSAREALAQAEQDAEVYARPNGRLIGMIDSFEIFENEDISPVMHGREIYSKVVRNTDEREDVIIKIHFGRA